MWARLSRKTWLRTPVPRGSKVLGIRVSFQATGRRQSTAVPSENRARDQDRTRRPAVGSVDRRVVQTSLKCGNHGPWSRRIDRDQGLAVPGDHEIVRRGPRQRSPSRRRGVQTKRPAGVNRHARAHMAVAEKTSSSRGSGGGNKVGWQQTKDSTNKGPKKEGMRKSRTKLVQNC